MTTNTVRVVEVWRETPVLTGVRLDAPDPVRARHVRPGQVIAARRAEAPDAKPVYLALASVPGARYLELLAGPAAVEQLGLVAAGAALEVEGPMGKGFPLDEAVGQDVLLFAVGSALAPIRPVVELIRSARGEYGRVSLYVGAMAEDAFAYRGDYDAWKRDRVDVVQVVHPQFVQNVFADDPLDVDEAVAFVCGMPEMMDGVTEVLARFGLPSERVHRNW